MCINKIVFVYYNNSNGIINISILIQLLLLLFRIDISFLFILFIEYIKTNIIIYCIVFLQLFILLKLLLQYNIFNK